MDKQKVDLIITEYLKKIYGFAIKKSFSYDEADELCSEIVSEVYISLLKSDEIFNIEGYIWRISQYTYSRYVSLKKKKTGISIDEAVIPFEEDFLGESDDENIFRLRREIAFLTERRRRIVYMFYYENKSVSSISREMAIAEGTVKWHLNKVRNDLKEGLKMERKIGKLGISPMTDYCINHNGCTGTNGGPEYYLSDKINLNIVYSVYFEPKTKEEIAEELGMTLVFIEDKIDLLEKNGFLVRVSGNRFSTYVSFSPRTYSLEAEEHKTKMQLKAADMLVREYVPEVRAAIADIKDVYIPSGNRELFEAAAIYYGIVKKASIAANKDISKYKIKTTDGGDYFVSVDIPSECSDPDYKATVDLTPYEACGSMLRGSSKYPVSSWSVDTKYSSRKGSFKDNHTSDYEYLYEIINGTATRISANKEKFERLQKRGFLSEDDRINIMIVKGNINEFSEKIPPLKEKYKEEFAKYVLDNVEAAVKNYPDHMRELEISKFIQKFIGNTVALMTMDILYGNGFFKPLSEEEKITSNLIMFSDILPEK